MKSKLTYKTHFTCSLTQPDELNPIKLLLNDILLRFRNNLSRYLDVNFESEEYRLSQNPKSKRLNPYKKIVFLPNRNLEGCLIFDPDGGGEVDAILEYVADFKRIGYLDNFFIDNYELKLVKEEKLEVS